MASRINYWVAQRNSKGQEKLLRFYDNLEDALHDSTMVGGYIVQKSEESQYEHQGSAYHG